MKRLVFRLLAVIGLLYAGGDHALPTQSAEAACASQPFGSASGFSGFFLGDFSGASDRGGDLIAGSEVEGRLAVGRNMTVKNYRVGKNLSSEWRSRDVLIVGKNVHYNGGQVFGNAVYDGTAVWGPNTVTVLGSIRRAHPIDFAAAKEELTAISAGFHNQPTNGTTTIETIDVKDRGPATAEITFTGKDPQLNVFRVSGADLSGTRKIIIDVPAGSTVLIDVTGLHTNLRSLDFSLKGVSRDHIIYNFSEATNLTSTIGNFYGSILAPDAHINLTSQVWGQMIGDSFVGPGELELAMFTGCVPVAPNPMPVPNSIGDTVWSDTNENQLQDADEPGLRDYTVTLYLDDGDGTFEQDCDDVLINTALTDDQGHYLFTDLDPGGYWVVVDPRRGHVTTTNHPMFVNLRSGHSFLDADFGIKLPETAVRYSSSDPQTTLVYATLRQHARADSRNSRIHYPCSSSIG